tara:strand:+ start:1249 stop:2079 length:831 start_codon:yes stop_codon:yes gene_type:complete
MPTKTGKAYANFYKNDLAVNQSSNTGVDATTRNIQDGAGNNTSISLSDDVLQVQPQNDDTTGALLVKTKGGTTILSADTSNQRILAGATQLAVNTQYAYFGCSALNTTGAASFNADTHYALPFAGANSFGYVAANVAMGTSTTSSFNDTNPATSLTISTSASDIVTTYWYVVDNITIDSVIWLQGADDATGDTTSAHLMSYDINTANGSTSGDLSSGAVVADGSNITNAGREQIYYQTMTVQSANVDAGKVILFTFASDTNNSDYTIQATVKYHIR